MQLMSHVTAGDDEDDRGTAARHRPAVPASRRSPCQVPLCAVLYPPAGRGSPAVQEAHLRTELARIETAERGLISELEQPADPADPAAQAYRARIRARFTDLYAERTRTEATLAELAAAAPQDNDPSLLDQLPIAAHVLADAPARIKEALLAAFDIQALYRSDKNQVTIWATLTENTPRTIAALLDDPPHRQRHRHRRPRPGHVLPFTTLPYEGDFDPR